MKNFIVIDHAPKDAWKQNEDNSPADMKKGMEEWMVWAEKCGDKLVDMGSPLANAMRLNSDGSSSSSVSGIAGYSVVQAEDMEEAKSLLVEHPHLKWAAGCDIEIHETMIPPGM